MFMVTENIVSWATWAAFWAVFGFCGLCFAVCIINAFAPRRSLVGASALFGGVFTSLCDCAQRSKKIANLTYSALAKLAGVTLARCAQGKVHSADNAFAQCFAIWPHSAGALCAHVSRATTTRLSFHDAFGRAFCAAAVKHH